MTSDTALLERPIVPNPVRRTRRWLPDVIGCVVVCLVILVGYHEVAFSNRTFSSSGQVPGSVLGGEECGTRSGDCVPVSTDDPRVDLGASAWQLEPWAQLNHQVLAQHEVPLWNSSEGVGLPLAANMQSGAFDPLLLALHLHPTPFVQDLTFLVGLLLIGLGAFLAARLIGLQALAATVSGSIFGLSGWFFVYSNSQWFRTYLYLGFLVAFVEWTLRSKRRLPIVLLAVSIAGMVAIGMPEPTFMALFGGALYAVVRLFYGPRVHGRWNALLRLAIGGGLGLALAAPLLLPFGEYLPLSRNTHADLADKPPATDPVSYLVNWMMPRISPSRSSSYAGSRTWVGAGAVILALAGFASRATFRKHVGLPIAVMGGVIAVQIYGGSLVSWTRILPYWSQVLWPTFATPIIALSLALLAGIGVQAIANRAVNARVFAALLAGLVVAVVIVVLGTPRVLAFGHDVMFRGGWPLAALVAAVIACLVIFAQKWKPVAFVVVGLVIVELLLVAPNHIYAPRADSYPARDWLTFVQDHTGVDGARVFSPDGLVFPDTAGVYGLSAPTMLDALYTQRYWDYLTTFVVHGLVDRFIGTGPTENAPNVAGNPMFDLLGIRYVLYEDETGNRPPEWSGTQYRPVFKSDGVTVYENTMARPRAFVVHDVHRVDDADAALAYLKSGEQPNFPDGSIQVVNKDVRSTAVVESDTDAAPSVDECSSSSGDPAPTVVDRSPNSIKIDVQTSCAGLLVLSDQYYPGWQASVNGEDAHIYATDVTLRGVEVPAGHSVVEFSYNPRSFRLGILVFLLAVGTILVVAIVTLYRSSRARRRARQAAPKPEAETVPEGLDVGA